MATIGFIGLGNMGSAMVGRLLEDGFDVAVWNRTAATAAPLVSEGATLLATPDAAFERDIVVSMLANDAAVDAVFNPELLAAVQGAMHINMASIGLELASELERRHAEAGVSYLAAPVLGRPPVARAGQLGIVVGGENETLELTRPVLESLGKRVWHLSTKPAAATLVKIAVNYNLIHALQALGESINLVERGGVDGSTFVEVLTDTAFAGTVYSGYGKIIAERSYFPAAFDAVLGYKDLTLTENAAAELGAALPAAPVLRELFEAAIADDELRQGDWSVIAEVIRSS